MLLAAGCVAGCAPRLLDPPPPAPVYHAVSCTEGDYLARSSSSATAVEGEVEGVVMGSVPDGFEPVAVVECTLEEGLVPPGDPVERERTMVEVRREGDLDDLLRALRRPSRARSQDCPQVEPSPTPPLLWLVDAGGRALVPVHPHDECWFAYGDVEKAVDALTVVDRTRHDLSEAPSSTR